MCVCVGVHLLLVFSLRAVFVALQTSASYGYFALPTILLYLYI